MIPKWISIVLRPGPIYGLDSPHTFRPDGCRLTSRIYILSKLIGHAQYNDPIVDK